MSKTSHEIRDSIHAFIRLDNEERKVLNSRPFQRLRHIHQLALTYLVYPGATHKRFEHSLGVMELASRVFDIVTNPENTNDELKRILSPLSEKDQLPYWRRVIRMAALCHDVGHLPFSHAAEKELLPDGWDHEKITGEIIKHPEMKAIWEGMTPPLRPDDIIKLALGSKKAKGSEFSDWETVLSEIIVGDAFGVDRMDYLLRDSHHIGVAYGKYDQFRLIDTMRILQTVGDSNEPALGIEQGGIHTVEALMLARYFMFSQVYFHPVRRIYDIHLMDFLKEWLEGSAFPTEVDRFLLLTDNEVSAALSGSAFDEGAKGHMHARRIIGREHFKRIYERNPSDIAVNPEAGNAVFEALCKEIGSEYVRHDRYSQTSGSPDFPVRDSEGKTISSLALSETLNKIPVVSVDYVFVERGIFQSAQKWLREHKDNIIKTQQEV